MSNNPYQMGGPHNYQYKTNQGGYSDPNRFQYQQVSPQTNQYSQPTYSNNLLNQPTFKQRNKAMYSSSMQFTTQGNQGFSSLDSMGRFVGDEKKQYVRTDYTRQNQYSTNQQNVSFFKNYANPGNSSSASGSTIPKKQGNFFDRFPAPNLQHPKTDSTALNQPARQEPTNPTETPEQKRKRQILEIKKQLDELNKKMAERTSQKKAEGTPQLYNPPETRQKNSAVSQSLIFDSKYSQQNSYDSNNFKTSNPISSIEQLYAKKKNAQVKNQQTFKYTAPENKIQNVYGKTSEQKQQSKFPTYNVNVASQNKYSYNVKTDNYSNNNPVKNQIYPSASSTSSSSNNNKVDDYSDNKFKFIPSTTTTTADKFIPSTTVTNNADKLTPTDNQQKYTPPQTYGKAEQFSFTKTNPTNQPPKASNPQYTIPSMKKQQQPIMGFKKKKQQPAVYQVSSIQPPKKMPQKILLNPIGLKRTNSDLQGSNQPPKLKQFKKSDFIIGKKLGKGQFGEVMIVRHKETGFLCGLKVMEKKQIRDQQYVGQIARELSIQFYLAHRNVAPLYGYFSDKQYVYLLIQYCIGGQLLERLRGQRRMNERDVALIMKQVCEGIDYIHKQLIIHRDIKPENILFNFGVVKISDFGWAVYRGQGLRKTASGSPLYYPPEIVKGEQYDDKIDVWNIGMMTYQCLLGKIPFRIYTEMDLDRIVSDDITFPSYVDVTDEAKDFILKTMRKKGDERMQIRQMLRHPFITKQKDTLLQQSILQQFKRVLS